MYILSLKVFFFYLKVLARVRFLLVCHLLQVPFETACPYETTLSIGWQCCSGISLQEKQCCHPGKGNGKIMDLPTGSTANKTICYWKDYEKKICCFNVYRLHNKCNFWFCS